ASVKRRPDGYWLADLGSANGTFVNGERLAGPRRLADGDLVGLGGPEPLLRFLDETLTVHRGEPVVPGPRLQMAHLPRRPS
ncbi:MAG: FHA domain-containing protein, partial [Caldilineales bacterium]|nr:FHA domain-containing protein [Caldilineales bacterium]